MVDPVLSFQAKVAHVSRLERRCKLMRMELDRMQRQLKGVRVEYSFKCSSCTKDFNDHDLHCVCPFCGCAANSIVSFKMLKGVRRC